MEINQNLHSTKKKNNAVVILAIILVLVLCVAGYYAYKYYAEKNNTVTNTTGPSTTQSSIQRDVADIMNLLRYPQAQTLTNGDKVSSTQVDDFTMQTDDSVAVVYDYYMNTCEENYWSLGMVNIDADQTSALISIEEEDFQADIMISSNISDDTTDVVIDIKTGNFTPSDNHDYELVQVSVSPTPSTTSDKTTSSTDSEGKVSISTDYVLPNTDVEVIETSDLESLSPWELKVARNEIYARHGRKFVHEDMQCYFDTKDWYTTNDSFSEADLSSIEIQNISIILDYEKSIDSPVMNKDLGC